jgi:hypothetical protein
MTIVGKEREIMREITKTPGKGERNMTRKIINFATVCLVSLLTNCTVAIIEPVETKLKVVNDLVDLNISIAGIGTDVLGINLKGVTFTDENTGDEVYFPKIAYNTSTPATITSLSGPVTIRVDSAFAVKDFLVAEVLVPITIRHDLSITITKGETNTFTFDSDIFNALTKKKVP